MTYFTQLNSEITGTKRTLKKAADKTTPLSLVLANQKNPHATPLGVFKLARKRWLEGKRISIGELANEVGVSRGTLYRWVGNKDLLIHEILWSLAKPTFERAVKETPGTGIEHIIGVRRHFMTAILSFPPMHRFINQDPKYALRIQTKDPRSAHYRLIKATEAHMREQEAQGHIRLPLPAAKLAEMLIHTNASLLYSEIIRGNTPSIEHACAIDRMLLMSGEILDDTAGS